VLFVIDLKTRRLHVAGVTSQADGAWMAQIARNLTDAAAGPPTGFGHLIVDRDPLYTPQRRGLEWVVTSGTGVGVGRGVGTGGTGTTGRAVGRGTGGAMGRGLAGVVPAACALGAVAGVAGSVGLRVAGFHAAVEWQSAHVVGNVECPGNLLPS
jgi:hypothetical protein